ncbi:hypothetical protein NCER_100241 [Vairimorpha ceranae BRL01]|uniref:Homeobox domain-containing protein n=1 Tax=Vairimorpha ceranae (strain BRL01) TaxID=578460 RepID=C4V731_VAIC1|nr:hypothetical protein NCER_100241 [Vairimorpha ceranae BRL01]
MLLQKLEHEADAIIGLVKLQRTNIRYKNNIMYNELTSLQNNVLYSVFRKSIFPSLKNKRDLGYLLGMSFECVEIWFRKFRKPKDLSNVKLEKISSYTILNIYLNEAVNLRSSYNNN